MNNHNKLPKTRYSEYDARKVKIKKDINFDKIKDKSGCISDLSFEYYNSKFQFSDFRNRMIQDKDWMSKPLFILDSVNHYYRLDTKGLELLFRHLVSLYQDLDTNLQRLFDGYHDSMFIRFALSSGIFTTEYHWEMLMRNWYLGWSMAMRRYYNACHHLYDVTSGISYVAYFDLHFSKYLSFAIGRADQTWQTPYTSINFAETEVVRLDQYDLSRHSVPESLEYDMDQETNSQYLKVHQLSLSPFAFRPIVTKLGNS